MNLLLYHLEEMQLSQNILELRLSAAYLEHNTNEVSDYMTCIAFATGAEAYYVLQLHNKEISTCLLQSTTAYVVICMLVLAEYVEVKKMLACCCNY